MHKVVHLAVKRSLKNHEIKKKKLFNISELSCTCERSQVARDISTAKKMHIASQQQLATVLAPFGEIFTTYRTTRTGILVRSVTVLSVSVKSSNMVQTFVCSHSHTTLRTHKLQWSTSTWIWNSDTSATLMNWSSSFIGVVIPGHIRVCLKPLKKYVPCHGWDDRPVHSFQMRSGQGALCFPTSASEL